MGEEKLRQKLIQVYAGIVRFDIMDMVNLICMQISLFVFTRIFHVLLSFPLFSFWLLLPSWGVTMKDQRI